MFTEDLLLYESQGNGVFIRWNGSFLFALGNEKYWKMTDTHWIITYTNTGGHVESNETIVEATKREVLEEIGCEINLLSSKRTMKCSLEVPGISYHELDDEICPILIYDSETLKMSSCIYLGSIRSNPTPNMEVPALVFLPPPLIQGGALTSLLNAGARLITQDEREIPKNTFLKPFGSVELLVNYWDDFLSLESFKRFLED